MRDAYSVLLLGKDKRLEIAMMGAWTHFQILFGLSLGPLAQMCDTADFENRHSLARRNRPCRSSCSFRGGVQAVVS